MRVLVFNQKGGDGKTTSAVNLAAGLARVCGQTVTLVDLDPQMHLTAGLGFFGEEQSPNVTDWLKGDENEPLHIEAEGELYLVPGSSAEREVDSFVVPERTEGEWLIMDAPPVWSPLLESALQQADFVLTPLEPDFLDLQGINRVMRTMQDVEIEWSKLRILISRFNGRQGVHREVRSRLAERFGAEMLVPLVIRNSAKLSEASGTGTSVFEHAPGSNGAQDYASLAKYFVGEAERLSESRISSPCLEKALKSRPEAVLREALPHFDANVASKEQARGVAQISVAIGEV